MARRIVVDCDLCRESGEDGEGHLVTVSIDSGLEMGFDLCDRHEKELIQPVRDLVERIGIPAGKLTGELQPPPVRATKPRYSGTFTCPACPDASYTQLQSLRSHFQSVHNYDTEGKQSIFMYGTKCPLCNEETGAELGRYHVPHAHPEIVGGGQAAFDAAIAAGDKFKVVKHHQDQCREILRAAETGKGTP